MQKLTVRKWIQRLARCGRMSFTKEEIREQIPDMPFLTLNAALHRACRMRLIASVWRGFYVILPPEYQDAGILPVSEYIDKLMRYLGRPYCVSLLNAAAFYGAAHQRPMTFTVMTSEPAPRNSDKQTNFLRFISKSRVRQEFPDALVRRIKTQYSSMLISSPEFTACSLVQYTKASGGLSRVLTVLDELTESCRFDRLPKELYDYVPTPVLQRLGYLLDSLLNRQTESGQLYDFISKSPDKTRRTKLDPALPLGGDCYDSGWKICVNTHPENDLDD